MLVEIEVLELYTAL